jgi:methylaspartate mutase sigma subunit
MVGAWILDYTLSDTGFKVAPGTQVTQEEFVDAALETKADVVPISFLSGHAEALADGFGEKCCEI